MPNVRIRLFVPARRSQGRAWVTSPPSPASPVATPAASGTVAPGAAVGVMRSKSWCDPRSSNPVPATIPAPVPVPVLERCDAAAVRTPGPCGSTATCPRGDRALPAAATVTACPASAGVVAARGAVVLPGEGLAAFAAAFGPLAPCAGDRGLASCCRRRRLSGCWGCRGDGGCSWWGAGGCPAAAVTGAADPMPSSEPTGEIPGIALGLDEVGFAAPGPVPSAAPGPAAAPAAVANAAATRFVPATRLAAALTGDFAAPAAGAEDAARWNAGKADGTPRADADAAELVPLLGAAATSLAAVTGTPLPSAAAQVTAGVGLRPLSAPSSAAGVVAVVAVPLGAASCTCPELAGGLGVARLERGAVAGPAPVPA